MFILNFSPQSPKSVLIPFVAWVCTEAESRVFADLGEIRIHGWGQLKSHWVWVNRNIDAPGSEGTNSKTDSDESPSQPDRPTSAGPELYR